MALHLYQNDGDRLLTAFESGSVTLWANLSKCGRSIEGRGWSPLWSAKAHVDSVMAMAVARENSLAVTVSADNVIALYPLTESDEGGTDFRVRIHTTKHPGNGAVAIRDDGRVCAVAGWDGRIRLYSTKSFKQLGVLAYHRDGCFAVAFARSVPLSTFGAAAAAAAACGDEDDDDRADGERADRRNWLVAGSKDSRVSVWNVGSFERPLK